MKLMLDISIPKPAFPIQYSDKIMLAGSCFTEHIGGRLARYKFSVLQNPNGILFDPLSLCHSLESYINEREYRKTDLFLLNELWQSWDHHSMFSGTDAHDVLARINKSLKEAHHYLLQAKHLVITLGSAFSYQLVEDGRAVANCHRAPAQTFKKVLLEVDQITERLRALLSKLNAFNPHLQVIFTISPVRHIRDGVVENNRSKARILEAVHTIVDAHAKACYFPAYELVIDVLRDYRFYDIDMVHPNYAATEFVFDHFARNYIETNTLTAMEEIGNITNAFNHKVMHPGTGAHKKFLSTYLEKVRKFRALYPSIDFSTEENYFLSGLK